MVNIGNSWDIFFERETAKNYYKSLRAFLANAYRTRKVHPDMNNLFSAFKATPIEKVRVVIIGQDPYHQPGQAHGMAFSVREGVPPPPSLQNIYKEIAADIGCQMSGGGYLMPWAEQGVFLLNACLSVEENKAGSHRGKGWETLTTEAICLLNDHPSPKAFLLWGRDARNKAEFLTNPAHLILEAPHPSPLSAFSGFFGCKHFSKANQFLESCGFEPIDWRI